MLCRANAGIHRRFDKQLTFKPFTAEQCLTLLRSLLEKETYKLPLALDNLVKDLFQDLMNRENFGNGWDVDNILSRIMRIHDDDTYPNVIVEEDIIKSFRYLSEQRSLLPTMGGDR